MFRRKINHKNVDKKRSVYDAPLLIVSLPLGNNNLLYLLLILRSFDKKANTVITFYACVAR